MTDKPVTKIVQTSVRELYDGRIDKLSLVLLVGGICCGLWQSYTDCYNLILVRGNVMSVLVDCLIACQYFIFSVLEAKHVFCRIRYKKHYADRIVAQPGKLIHQRLICLEAIALVGIFKVFRSLVYHEIAIAIDLIKDHLFYAEYFAVLAFSFDITYLQELSESSSDLIQHDVESKAGHSEIDQIAEIPLSGQTPPNIPESESQLEVR